MTKWFLWVWWFMSLMRWGDYTYDFIVIWRVRLKESRSIEKLVYKDMRNWIIKEYEVYWVSIVEKFMNLFWHCLIWVA